ncbi:MAG: radical SAM protein [Acidobacteria bacterium]|nr:radical SAM protein [Acidobacteriota bacterium]
MTASARPRPVHDPFRHQGVLVEPEADAAGRLLTTATVFLTGSECAWRCVMCDLWRHTTETATPAGAIPAQLRDAHAALRGTGTLPDVWKLYNAGSYFDRRAVPPEDDEGVAELVSGSTRVVVESHPALVGDRAWRFRDLLARRGTTLEVAMGLETAHPEALDAINKGVTRESFAAAADALRREGVALRVFLLVHPPVVPADRRGEWLRRSVRLARSCGAEVISLIPTRSTERALQALAAAGAFVPPTLADLEEAFADALAEAGPRVFADTWDLDAHAACPHCVEARRSRLARQNAEQRTLDAVTCGHCAEALAS